MSGESVAELAVVERAVNASLKRRVAKVYPLPQRAEILECAAQVGPTEASRKFGVTRFPSTLGSAKLACTPRGRLRAAP